MTNSHPYSYDWQILNWQKLCYNAHGSGNLKQKGDQIMDDISITLWKYLVYNNTTSFEQKHETYKENIATFIQIL
eukprot:snap_masked-scaffold_81-processed-gene-0.39-mRNA-1 protein AED:1.00 eAED:1.00 QI:0/0/0/0/1/1/2/0/74